MRALVKYIITILIWPGNDFIIAEQNFLLNHADFQQPPSKGFELAAEPWQIVVIHEKESVKGKGERASHFPTDRRAKVAQITEPTMSRRSVQNDLHYTENR